LNGIDFQEVLDLNCGWSSSNILDQHWVHINQNVAWVAYVKDFMFINNINGCQPQAIGVILAWE
jgi:hypothetical protein